MASILMILFSCFNKSTENKKDNLIIGSTILNILDLNLELRMKFVLQQLINISKDIKVNPISLILFG
jgi:hypothetical protein